MDIVDITIVPQSLKQIFDYADRDKRPYSLVRVPMASGFTSIRFVVKSDDWTGPEPCITLNADGTWTASLDVYFG